MSIARGISAAVLVGLLGACEARPTAEETTMNSAEPAAGKAEKGQFSLKGPGFDLKIAMPEGVKDQPDTDGDNDLLYPGASIRGMHIETRQSDGAAPNSGVELRFDAAAAPEEVAAWYRDPARAQRFEVAATSREGDALVLSGRQKSDGDPFSLRLSPNGSGGTDGRLTLSGGGR